MSEGLEQRLLEEVDGNEDGIVSLCYQLVSVSSENPPGDTTAIGNFVAGLFEQRGLECRIIAPQTSMPNVVATIEGNGPGRHLVFNGHMDTYPVGIHDHWTVNPYGEVRDGRIYGRGAADMKGGVTASLMAFFMLAKYREHWPGKATITLVSDEETGGRWGTEFLLRHHPELHGDAVLNGEPSSPGVAFFAEKGQHWYRLQVTTRGGHSAYAYEQQNAIEALLAALEDLKRFEDIELRPPQEIVDTVRRAQVPYDAARRPGASDAVLRQSYNLGIIKGGTKINMAPEHAEAEVDFRLPPGVPPHVLYDFLESVMDKHRGVTMSLIKETPATTSAIDNPLLQAVVQAGTEVTGTTVYPAVSMGGTDVRYWRMLGIDSAIYGPTHHNMASPDEYITIDDLMKAARVHTLASFRYLCGSGS